MPRQTRPDAPSAPLLFWQCLVIGVTSFGGGLTAYVRLVFVSRRKWVTEDEFLECMEVAQALPGPNVINLVLMLGRLLRGTLGAILGFTGLVFPAVVANIALVAFVLGRAGGAGFNAVLAGCGAAAAGLSIANAGQMGRAHLRRPMDIGLTVVAVGLILWLKPSLVVAIALFGGLGVGLHYLKARRAQAANGTAEGP
ncbi:MAG: chromate transporter [Candidatus Nanopelagicales bacterium]